MAGQMVELSRIKVPVLNIGADGDYIAPPPSVTALADLIPQTENVVLPGGHIGAVVSYRASKKLWPAIAGFVSGTQENQPTTGA